MDFKEKFQQILNSDVTFVLPKIEVERKKYLKFLVLFDLAVLAGIVYLCYFVTLNPQLYKHPGECLVMYFFSAVTYPVLLPWFYTLFSKRFVRKIKYDVAGLLSKAFGDLNIKSSEPNYVEYKDLIKNIELRAAYEMFEIDDYYEGVLGNLKYDFSDISLLTNSDKPRCL